jgi:hypothetical protein
MLEKLPFREGQRWMIGELPPPDNDAQREIQLGIGISSAMDLLVRAYYMGLQGRQPPPEI